MSTHTHTFAKLEISQVAFDEIRLKLLRAGYEEQCHNEDGEELIDMHGIAIVPESK
jgi:hypothetical protein